MLLARAVGVEGIIDRPAAKALIRHLAKNSAVVVATERNDCQAAEQGIFDEPSRLVR